LTSGSFSDGWGIGIAQGRRITNALRGELEFAFRSNTGDNWSVNGATGDWSGHVFNYIGMANLFLDLNMLSCHGATPYVGAGIGFDVVDGDFRTNATRIEIEDTALAYQFIAGVSKQVTMNIDLFAEYRYLATTDLDVYNIGVNPKVLLDSTPAEMESVFFGLRFYR
jgi:opacity protein-like surface antigen